MHSLLNGILPYRSLGRRSLTPLLFGEQSLKAWQSRTGLAVPPPLPSPRLLGVATPSRVTPAVPSTPNTLSPSPTKRGKLSKSRSVSDDVDNATCPPRHATEMYLSSAERLVLQSSACRLTVDRDGHEIAVVLSDKTPLMVTFSSLLMMVRGQVRWDYNHSSSPGWFILLQTTSCIALFLLVLLGVTASRQSGFSEAIQAVGPVCALCMAMFAFGRWSLAEASFGNYRKVRTTPMLRAS
jgi:hypothetical protein